MESYESLLKEKQKIDEMSNNLQHLAKKIVNRHSKLASICHHPKITVEIQPVISSFFENASHVEVIKCNICGNVVNQTVKFSNIN